MDIPTIDDIRDYILDKRFELHPGIKDMNPYSINYTLAETEAELAYTMYTILQETVLQSSPLTATGDSLDIIVVDRLPAGRYEGTRSTGNIVFRAPGAVVAAVTVPQGSRAIAVGQDGSQVWFETTADGIIDVGYSSVAIASRAMEPGISGNVGAYDISVLPYSITGISRCENVAAFTGGTDEETDDELRQRYLSAINAQGRATLSMIENRLTDLLTVYEASLTNAGSGDVQTVVDCENGNGSVDSDVTDVLEENLAVGIMSIGIIGAQIVNGSTSHSLEDCAGGYIYVRSAVAIPNSESIEVRYTNQSGIPDRVATVTVPSGIPRGQCTAMTMQHSTDRATLITGITYTGTSSYDVIISMAAPPYGYITPTIINTSVAITLTTTATPEVGLADNIEASITAFLDDYSIGDDIEFSDVVEYVYNDYDTGRKFVGIERINSMTVSAKGSTISGFGQIITIDSDERVEPATITVTT